MPASFATSPMPCQKKALHRRLQVLYQQKYTESAFQLVDAKAKKQAAQRLAVAAEHGRAELALEHAADERHERELAEHQHQARVLRERHTMVIDAEAVKMGEEVIEEDFSRKLEMTFAAAARANNMQALLYLHSVGVHPSPRTLRLLANEVAKRGHVQVLVWLKNIGADIPNTALCIAACEGEQEHVLEWALDNGYDFLLGMSVVASHSDDHTVKAYTLNRVKQWVQEHKRPHHQNVGSDEFATTYALSEFELDNLNKDNPCTISNF